MNCNEVRELLNPLVDGELDPAREETVRQALADCPDCQAELAEVEAVRALAREAFSAPVEEVDFTGFYDGVMARIANEEHAAALSGVPILRAEQDEPGLWQRLSTWLGELLRFERPLAAVASAAVLAILVGGIVLLQPAGDGGSPSIAPAAQPMATTAQQDSTHGKRRGREYEGRNAASVEEIEVAVGRVEIDENTEDPDRPMVVWHIVDEGAVPAAEQEL